MRFLVTPLDWPAACDSKNRVASQIKKAQGTKLSARSRRISRRERYGNCDGSDSGKKHRNRSSVSGADESELYPRGRGVFVDAVVLAILSKSIRVGEAICLLVEHDFHSEAFGLSRTMLELALFARHISNADSWKRSETFVKYFAKDHEGWTKLMAKYYPSNVPNFHRDHAKMLEIAKQFQDPHKWSGKSVRDLAMEVDTFEVLPDGSPLIDIS